MKKSLLFILSLWIALPSFSQVRNKPVYRADKYNISAVRPEKKYPTEQFRENKGGKIPASKAMLSYNETVIGETTYDLQTSGSSASRIYVYPDNTIGTSWMFGVNTPDFGDRGTAYNYFDGTSWGQVPDTRIETVKTGYPSYIPYGTSGEATIAHDFGTPGGLVICKRDQKGSGTWNQLTIPGPTGQNGLAWPRMVSSGPNHQHLHTIAITRPLAYPGGTLYQGMNGAILYSRSSDGGASWNISNALLPGMTAAEYNGFESNSYAFAEPKDNTIAFVVGDTWTDLFLMKSENNGDTWTKTIIFQHPYPKFDETHDLVTDTPWVCDGGVAVALDNQGKAHVFFGLMRVLNSDTTDAITSYFPYTDGMAYWNEDMPAFPSLNFDTLWNQNHLVGYLQDLNGNDTVMEFIGIGTYYLSLSGMPSVCISPENVISVCYSSVSELLDNGSENYRHIWAAVSNNGESWNYHDINGSIIHNFHECVFPFLSPTVTLNPSGGTYPCIHLLYQYDEEPGMAVWGSDPPDPYTNNYIVYGKYCLENVGIAEPVDNGIRVQINPNPAIQYIKIEVELQRPSVIIHELRNSVGQLVYNDESAELSAGEHHLTLDVTRLTPGLYFYILSTKDYRITKKLVVQ
ncbi:MAG: T9SS type A sorting domain-containing protein [Bacteroidales bacterium]